MLSLRLARRSCPNLPLQVTLEVYHSLVSLRRHFLLSIYCRMCFLAYPVSSIILYHLSHHLVQVDHSRRPIICKYPRPTVEFNYHTPRPEGGGGGKEEPDAGVAFDFASHYSSYPHFPAPHIAV